MLYERVVALCGEKGITVAALEKELGLGNATIRKWSSSSPRADKLKLVADFFGVSMDALMTEKAG